MSAGPVQLAGVETLTFDCYGTLIDWESGAKSTLRVLLAMKDIRADEEAFFRDWERAQRAHIQQSYAPYRQIAAAAFQEAARAQSLPLGVKEGHDFADSIPTWKPFADVPAALQRLKRILGLAIISNIDDDILAASVKQLGIEFDLLQTAEQVRAYKPSPLPFERALERLELPAAKVAHAAFGFEYDIRTAAELGLRTILVRRTRSDFPLTPVPDLSVADLTELAALFP